MKLETFRAVALRGFALVVVVAVAGQRAGCEDTLSEHGSA